MMAEGILNFFRAKPVLVLYHQFRRKIHPLVLRVAVLAHRAATMISRLSFLMATKEADD
jgi:hypothetical protein